MKRPFAARSGTLSDRLARALRVSLVAFLALAPAGVLHPQAGVRDTDEAAPLVDRLTSLLEKREGDRFWVTVNRLEALGKGAVPALREKLDDPNERTRLGCAKALLQIGDLASQEAALDTLSELAREAESRDVRIDAIQVYGQQGDFEEVLAVLGKLFEETLDPLVQISLARTLWDVDHVTEARDRLVELLGSNDLEVRYEAALTLAEMNYFEGEVRSILRSLKKEPTPRGRRAALLDEVMRLSRQLERNLDQGALLLDADPAKLVEIKEQRIRELEDTIERLAQGRAPAGAATPGTRANRVLEEVIDLVQEHYVDPRKTSREHLLTEAVKGMVRSLDEHSTFMDTDETREFRQGLHGEYHGIGAQVSKQPEGPLEILRPIYGGPAFRSGMQSGDKIIEIEGVRTDELTMEEVMKLLQGPKGTSVKLKVWRRGWTEYRDFTITRETIEVPSVYYDALPEGIGYIRLTQFGFRSTGEFIDALEELETEGLRGLVIDLRNNPGGFLQAALKIADLFVRGELPIVTEKGRGGGSESENPHYPTEEARTGYPIVILVNRNSASASEIVAGALQDYGRATVVGKRTYGKGSVQQPLPVDSMEGSQLKLTVRYYYLPHGRCIHTIRDEDGRVVEQGGVEPDLIVDPEPLPTWRLEERADLRDETAILDYVDEHFETLSSLVPLGDRGDDARYPELDALLAELDTRALPGDVKAVVRHHIERRLEDQRGRQFAIDLMEDAQLQAAIRHLLERMGGDPSKSEAYSWIEPLEEDAAKER